MTTPHSSLEPQWLAARGHEARGELDAARDIHESVLRADPTQAYAWHRLSAIAAIQGRHRDARNAAMQGTAIAVAHRRWKILPYLTRQLLGFDEREAVRRAIAAADWSDPAILAQSAVLAQQLWLADDHEQGLRLADRGLQSAPRSHLLHYVRANLLRHLGRAGEATAAFEQAIALAPAFAEAHWALAHHAASAVPGARVARVRAALAQSGAQPDPMVPVYLGHALFKELDHAGDTDAAWAALDAAAAVMRGQVQHDDASEQATLDALRTAFDTPEPLPAAVPAAHAPIFIVGMPRTGTTVLERILGNHSRVADGGELNAFGASMGLALDQPFASPPTAAQVREAAAIDLAPVGAMYLERTAALYGERAFLVDKNPLNAFNAGFIARALPQARILCLVRGPMDACFSNFKELFPGGGYGYSYDLAALAGHWRRFRAMVEHWRAMLPGRFMVVEYEALVTEPARVAAEAMAFCGLAFEPDSVDITRNAAPVSTASSSQVRHPIHRGGIDAWRRYQHQLAPLEAMLEGETGTGGAFVATGGN